MQSLGCVESESSSVLNWLMHEKTCFVLCLLSLSFLCVSIPQDFFSYGVSRYVWEFDRGAECVYGGSVGVCI